MTNIFLPFLNEQIRNKVAFGGRGGTKSHTCVDILIVLVAQYGKRVCLFREFGSSIEDSIWSLIADEITRMEVPGFTVQRNAIYHISGGVFKSKGLGRDSKSVKSFSNFDIFLIEEGDFLTQEILDDLTPTLRKESSELWLIFNPQSREDAVSKRFIIPYYKQLLADKMYRDEDHYIIWTNIDENPWAPQVLLDEMERDRELMTSAAWDHKWGGHFNDHVENGFILAEWFDAAVDAHIKLGWEPEGAKIVTHDLSDLGPDDKTRTLRHGTVIVDCERKSTGRVTEGMKWATDYAIFEGADHFSYDADGMGVGLFDQVETSFKGIPINVLPFNGGGEVANPGEIAIPATDARKAKTNKDMFFNRRSQFIWLIAERFRKTYEAIVHNKYSDPSEMISISSKIKDIEVLRAEACRIPRVPNGQGKIQAMSKPDMKKKFKIDSPNMFDGVMMSEELAVSAFKKNNSAVANMEFDSLWA